MIAVPFVIFVQLLLVFRCISTAESGDPLEEQYGSLKHASILHRHGDRGPIQAFPLDPYKDYPWPDGFGQLINKGKRRLFEVGKWFRARYGNFLNETYSRRHVLVHSSSMDRCVMSTQCLLYGLYPAVGEQVWLPDEKWHPIPVYAIPENEDNKLRLSKKCKLRDALSKKELNHLKYVQTYDKYKETMDIIVNETGIDVANKTKAEIIASADHVYGTLTVYVQNNLTLPEWTKHVFPEPLQTILSETTWDIPFSVQTARLDIGPFLESIIKDMTRKVTKGCDQKLHVHSAHDTNVKAVLVGLKAYDGVWPHYGSHLMFELREKNSTNYVTVSYRNDTEVADAKLLNIPGCGLTCTFEQFVNLTKPIIPENWDAECESVDSGKLPV